ncbi:hypothetical protein AB0L82_26170 [Nocardia sp. NPDC052001]|uniref:hypothetical protein n=1 Tax=Nocardia sp. NPDC052001 TaxID=3154853 RepID=UPI00341857AE
MTTNHFQMNPELPAWLWTLPPATLLAMLDPGGSRAGLPSSIQDYYWIQLREMGLHLIVDAPALPATTTAEFLSRFNPHTLAALWGGEYGAGVWTGAPGVDGQIAALLVGKVPVLAGLLAEVTNLFRYWAAFPAELESAVRVADPAASLTSLGQE